MFGILICGFRKRKSIEVEKTKLEKGLVMLGVNINSLFLVINSAKKRPFFDRKRLIMNELSACRSSVFEYGVND